MLNPYEKGVCLTEPFMSRHKRKVRQFDSGYIPLALPRIIPMVGEYIKPPPIEEKLLILIYIKSFF